MAVQVLDSKDLVKSLETGEIPVPAEVAADRAGPKAVVKAKPEPAEAPKAPEEPEEDESGLTEEQRKTFTQAMQRTIAKKHRQLKEAEEFAAAQYNDKRLAEQRLATLESELAALKKQGAAEAAPAEAKAPERKDFASDADYQNALIDYRVDQKLKAQQKEAQERLEREREEQLLQVASNRIAKAMELVPDFKEVTEAVDTQVPPYIAAYMQESELFAELGYYFAKHPEELERLSKLPARTVSDIARVGIALDKIERTLQPFAPKSAKASNGAQPSPETESASGADPSTETESDREVASPSKPRESAPVIRPLPQGSGAQVEKNSSLRSTREEIIAWQKSHGTRLQGRKRH